MTVSKNQYFKPARRIDLTSEINEMVADHEVSYYSLITRSGARNNVRSRFARSCLANDSEKGMLNGELKRTRSGFKRSMPCEVQPRSVGK